MCASLNLGFVYKTFYNDIIDFNPYCIIDFVVVIVSTVLVLDQSLILLVFFYALHNNDFPKIHLAISIYSIWRQSWNWNIKKNPIFCSNLEHDRKYYKRFPFCVCITSNVNSIVVIFTSSVLHYAAFYIYSSALHSIWIGYGGLL